MVSLEIACSLATGLFCLDKLAVFKIGPDDLLRVGSVGPQPMGLPSSPPGSLSAFAASGGIPELGPALGPRARVGGVAI